MQMLELVEMHKTSSSILEQSSYSTALNIQELVPLIPDLCKPELKKIRRISELQKLIPS